MGERAALRHEAGNAPVTSLKYEEGAMQNGRLAVLARAVELVGGREELARRLEVRPQLLDSWLAGATPIPETVFLKAVDVVSVPER